jgi:type II secretory ATPase GspE/PulE/Tfp pilus assembly ATPase PilB-like protein
MMSISAPVYVPLNLLVAIYNHVQKSQVHTASVDENFNSRFQKDFVNIVSQAASKKVSDIHVIVSEHTTVMFRINGTMQTVLEYDNTWGESFVRAVFASTDISDANYAQNEFQAAQKLGDTPLRGASDLYLPGNVLAIRLQFNPIAFGTRYLVMRLLYANTEEDQSGDLFSLGFTEYENRHFKKMRAFPTGLIVVAGPTGSGKSTTLQRNMISLLEERKYEINLITVEDPPEYPIPGARQMPVTNAATEEEKDEAFTKALSAALRSDPDALMVGEIRTLSAAKLTFKGALSGHNVWTTLHANSAPVIVTRLLDIGIEEFKLRDPELLKGLVSQRLFKTVCPDCKLSLKDHPEHETYQRVKNALGEYGIEQTYLRGKGCQKCGGKGVVGRTVASEIILPDAEFLRLLLKGETKEAIDYWIGELKGRTLKDAAIEKMLQGIIDIEELERWCGFIDERPVY